MLAIDPHFQGYANPWFSVQAVACTEIISFPYTPSDLDPAGPRISLNHPQIAHVRKTVPFGTARFHTVCKRVRRPCDPALRAGAGGGLRLLPVWIVRAAVGQVDERVFAPKGHNIGAGRRRLKRRVEANEAAPRGAKGFRNP